MTFHVITRTKGCLARACILALLVFAGTAPAIAEPRTADDLIETSCGNPDSALNVLIAYDTIHGSTAEIAEFIGNRLCAAGLRCDVRLARTVEDASGYDAVVIGSAIYQFAWLSDAKNFIAVFSDELSQRPTAYFIVGASMQADTPESRSKAREAFIDPLLQQFPEITPVAIGLFGGAVDFTTNRYNLFERIVLRILGILLRYRSSADWRNWESISQWSDDFAEAIAAEQ